MIKANDRTKGARDYIWSLINEKIKITEIESELQKKIPMIIKNSYTCLSSYLFGIPVVFCYPKNETNLTPATIQRHMELLSININMHCIVILNNIPSYNIQRLVIQRVNFVIIDKQMFIPSLLLDMRKLPIKDQDIKEEIPSLAQCLILYNITIENIWLNVSEIMEKFSVSYSTVNRTIRWLQSKDMIISSRGTDKKLQFIKQGRDLWEASIRYLTSPIEKVVYTDEIPSDATLCGISALSSYSNALFTSNEVHYAITKDQLKSINVNIENVGKYKVEIWQYDPKLLSKTNIVDRLSLYLALKNCNDELIQTDIEYLIKTAIHIPGSII